MKREYTILLVVVIGILALMRNVSSAQVGSGENSTSLQTSETSEMKQFEKPNLEELKKKLTREQYSVTQEEGTERPFANQYWDNKQDGIYVDVVSGEPLFSSKDKYDSGTGWPSFTQPISQDNVALKTDKKLLFQTRTEVRSKQGDSHLGHLFDDGPGPDGKRFCMNSAAMRFIPVEDLEKEGYGTYLSLFRDKVQGGEAAKQMSEVAYLAGGCFWGMEEILRSIPGVVDVRAGYTGGNLANPVYDLVHGGASGHAESVKVTFNPQILPYGELLKVFFRMHDPTTKNRQGNDRGTEYRSAIFYLNDEQRNVAEKVKAEVDASKKWANPIVTEIVKAGEFFEAEEHHQDYLQKNPGGYTCHYLRD